MWSPAKDQLQLSRLIAQLRKRRGLTQAKLGELVFLTEDSVWRLEHGTRRVTEGNLDALVAALEGVSLRKLSPAAK